MLKAQYMRIFKVIWQFLKDIYKNRYTIYQLTKRDYKSKYIGSNLGFAWSIIQPFVMITVLWFVFTKGLKVGPMGGGDVPFVAWLTIGIIAWDLFATTLMGATNVFQEYSYLVKKINFRFSILPIVKLLSSSITHCFLLIIGMVVLLSNGISFSFYWFQGIYYFFASLVLLLGLSWITSSIQVFHKDISQIVTTVLQVGFWATPIFWDFSMVPEKYQFLFKLNPMFYIVEGYRRSFIYHAPFWEARDIGLYFWITTLTILILGIVTFKKLKPNFADVL